MDINGFPLSEFQGLEGESLEDQLSPGACSRAVSTSESLDIPFRPLRNLSPSVVSIWKGKDVEEEKSFKSRFGVGLTESTPIPKRICNCRRRPFESYLGRLDSSMSSLIAWAVREAQKYMDSGVQPFNEVPKSDQTKNSTKTS